MLPPRLRRDRLIVLLDPQYKLSEDLCYKLPQNVSLEEGALFEPLAVAVNSVAKVGDLHPHKNVAIFGAGPVGLLCMAGMWYTLCVREC